MMKNLDTNMIISIGLVFMGGISILGWIYISAKAGTSSGTEIPIAIIGGLTGVISGKAITEQKYKHILENNELPQQRNKTYDELSDEDKKRVDDMINKIMGSEVK